MVSTEDFDYNLPEELIAQIGKCPSGALSYRLNKKEK